MCGICGFTNATDDDLNTLHAMCDVMAHRGPDGEGYYLQNGVALGHRRLSLIDLEKGSQPMLREEGNYAIVFNGEIYNYKNIMSELTSLGWSFNTNSDTEVLLVSYLQWGTDLLKKIRGMFAFAIYDAIKNELFCARDFFGIKPFYYTLQNNVFIFASEIKSILEHPAYTRQLNRDALAQYLCFQFSALPETFFKEIFKLEPAHYIIVKMDGSIKKERYWKPKYDFDKNRTLENTANDIHSAMQESVRYHNVADVEVGSFLSSGIDSSYMAACLAQENPSVKTFTVGFSEYMNEKDEISWAKELAKKIDVANTHKHITEEEYWSVLPLVQWHMDEPCADPSAVALYFVDQIAAKQVKAVLSGEGADEFFGGYKIYQTPLSNAKLSWMPKNILLAGSSILRKLGIRGANYLKRASKSVEDWYYTNANGVAFSVEERKRLLVDKSDYPTPQQLTASVYKEVNNMDEITKMQYLDLYFWLVGDILLKTDKMSMAHSLESRVPFLDKEVFGLSCTIPPNQKVSNTQTKIALRKASLKAIPDDWAQKEKLGFPVPVAEWLKEDKYFEIIKNEFTSDIAREFFDTNYLVTLLYDHKNNAADNTRKIWIIYMFLMWYRIYFIDKKNLNSH